jgi:cation diffusion facilitator CzcD-associated flavoprotein CzcO
MTAPIGLAAHEAMLARELALLNLPPREWVPRRCVAGQPVLDVAIVGGGVSGLCAAAALRFLGIANTLILDRSPAGYEGPWLTFARMHTLRTEKSVTGPALGVPGLTPRAWYEAQHGAAAWATMERLPRALWMEYLVWYRRVLDLPMRNDTAVTAIVPRPDGLIRLDIAGPGGEEGLLARRVVLATGLDGFGAPYLPPVARGINRRRVAHSSDAIDFAALAGCRVGVVGAGASAMDNASAALEAGAASVDMLIRRPTLPRIDRFSNVASKGMSNGFVTLSDAEKWRFFTCAAESQLPPPRHSLLRVMAHGNAKLHFSSPIEQIIEHDGALGVITPIRRHMLDFLIFATGFAIDFAARPELAAIAPHIRLWQDSFSPPVDQANAALALSPYLGPAFELQERHPGECPALPHITAFNYPAVLSHGKLTSGIPSVSEGAQRLARGIAGGLFREDGAAHFARFATHDRSELRGDEWTSAAAPVSPETAYV